MTPPKPSVAQPRDWADVWAQDFHETYERAAPLFNYETRRESAKPWVEVPENNRKLMRSVVAEVLCRFLKSREQPVSAETYASKLRAEVERLTGERDRFREALVKIAGWDLTKTECKEIASAALKASEDTK